VQVDDEVHYGYEIFRFRDTVIDWCILKLETIVAVIIVKRSVCMLLQFRTEYLLLFIKDAAVYCLLQR
jgi:hypothetical protein